jgi:alpha-1,3-glucosyltransferase
MASYLHVDADMLNYRKLEYASLQTIYFQRLSVIATDGLLLYAVYRYLSSYTTNISSSQSLAISRIQVFLVIAFNSALLLVDHVHFQYNGMLLGLLILCFYFASTRQYLSLAVAFSSLVLMKHLFAPLALVFGVHLLNFYCCYDQEYGLKQSYLEAVRRFMILIVIAALMLAAAFIPILLSALTYSKLSYGEVLAQIISRLFPFGRGLVHAYWAPNFWAIYCITDKVLSKLLHAIPSSKSYLSLQNDTKESGYSSTSGLVGNFRFDVLPSVEPAICLLLMLVAIISSLLQILKRYPATSSNTRNKDPIVLTTKKLIQVSVFVSMSSFMLGYHVHEKAIIVPMICQAILLIHTRDDHDHDDPYDMMNKNSSTVSIFLLLSMIGTYSLFPLFVNLQEFFTKTFLWLAYNSMAYFFFGDLLTGHDAWIYNICGTILLLVFVYAEIFHPAAVAIDDEVMFSLLPAAAPHIQRLKQLEFFPLMLTSVSCAMMLCYVWLRTFYQAISQFSGSEVSDPISESNSPRGMKRSLSDEIIEQSSNMANELMRRLTPRSEEGDRSPKPSPPRKGKASLPI